MSSNIRDILVVVFCLEVLGIMLFLRMRRTNTPRPTTFIGAISDVDQDVDTDDGNADLMDALLQAKRFRLDDGRGPLLTLCTTMADIPEKKLINANTLMNWDLLRPWVHAILYVTDESSTRTRQALSLGWVVRTAPETRLGVPLLRSMFQDAINVSDTPFYGYANGDMLFHWDILHTLEFFLHHEEILLDPEDRFLLVGIRTNVLLSKISSPVIPDNVPDIAALGEDFSPDAEDYFITTRHGLPWRDIPDFVIGRPIYDNWLVAMAIQWNAIVVDGSGTITAVHQTGPAGNTEGSQHANTDMNRDLVPDFKIRDVKRGFTICAPYETAYNDTRLTLIKRPVLPDACKGIEHMNYMTLIIIISCVAFCLIKVFIVNTSH